MIFLHWVAVDPLSDKVRISVIRETQTRVAAPAYRDEPVYVVLASSKDAPRMPPWSGVTGVSITAEGPGETQDMLERLYSFDVKETAQCPPLGAEGGVEKQRSGSLCLRRCPWDQIWVKWKG